MRYVFPVFLGLMVAAPILAVSPAFAQQPAQPPAQPGGQRPPPPTEPPPPTLEERVQKLEETSAKTEEGVAKVGDAALAGHNAWMLTSCALVLFMTGPGLALFYCGLVRKKNVLSVMMQCVTLMALMTVIWGLYGYSLAFGGSNAWFGNGEYLFMRNVDAKWNHATNSSDVPKENSDKIPRITHMVFQGMFFIITPALICGAFAERMKFSAMVLFMILWGTLVYCPLAHWVWDGGVLAYLNNAEAEQYFQGGALDFAGGTVVHMSSGFSALICALLIGKRLGFGSEDMRPHNLTYTAMGAAMLWVGWFGFNGGSQLASDGVAASAFAATHFAAAAGAIAWAAMEWIFRGKPSVLGACSGLVAGLVCITPASGYVTCMPALGMGAAAGIVCYFACTWLKSNFKYDDALDAFGVHGIGGTLGAVLTGVFATRAVLDVKGEGLPLGLVPDGNTELLKGQFAAVGVTIVLSVVGTFIILKVLDAVMGLRVSQQQEIQGLDVTQHGEEGYIFH
ncbi:MAG: ammonium transporter [Planctomycetia bacterium]|nr:ammonium transporter [Planctomycetia bacterium]